MSWEARATIVDFFRKLGAPPVAVSRETLSRELQIAYPTLDKALYGLELEGKLEKHPYADGQWKAARTFEFLDPAERAKALAEAAEQRKQARIARAEQNRITNAAKAVDREARRAARRKLDEEILAAARLASDNRAARVESRKERIDAGRQIEKQLRLAEKQYTKDTTGRPAPGAAASVSNQPPAPADPWARIRERHYGKPPLVASNLRQLSKEELMTGRVRRQA